MGLAERNVRSHDRVDTLGSLLVGSSHMQGGGLFLSESLATYRLVEVVVEPNVMPSSDNTGNGQSSLDRLS